MDEKKTLISLDEIKAFSDPYRYRILNAFYRFGEPATVKQIADDLGEIPSKIHYHVKKLEKYDIVKLIFTREINGIIAKYYEPTAKSFDIQGNKENMEANKNLILGETQRMFSEVYNTSRDNFIKQVGLQIDYKEKALGAVCMEELFLTMEEAEELRSYLEDYTNKHRTKNNENKRKKFSFFFSIIEDK